jgi:hypothetical protein
MNSDMEMALWKLYDAAKALLRNAADKERYADCLWDLDDAVHKIDLIDEEYITGD